MVFTMDGDGSNHKKHAIINFYRMDMLFGNILSFLEQLCEWFQFNWMSCVFVLIRECIEVTPIANPSRFWKSLNV